MEREEHGETKHCKRHLLLLQKIWWMKKPTKVCLEIIIDLEHSVKKASDYRMHYLIGQSDIASRLQYAKYMKKNNIFHIWVRYIFMWGYLNDRVWLSAKWTKVGNQARNVIFATVILNFRNLQCSSWFTQRASYRTSDVKMYQKNYECI